MPPVQKGFLLFDFQQNGGSNENTQDSNLSDTTWISASIRLADDHKFAVHRECTLLEQSDRLGLPSCNISLGLVPRPDANHLLHCNNAILSLEQLFQQP